MGTLLGTTTAEGETRSATCLVASGWLSTGKTREREEAHESRLIGKGAEVPWGDRNDKKGGEAGKKQTGE